MNEVPDQIFQPVENSSGAVWRTQEYYITRAVLTDVINRISRIKQPSTFAYYFQVFKDWTTPSFLR